MRWPTHSVNSLLLPFPPFAAKGVNYIGCESENPNSYIG